MSARTLPDATFARTLLGSGPGLALAHGAGSSVAGTYGPILEGLAARHTVVGIDYPGSGDTPRSTTPLSLDDLADQLVAAAVAEGLDTFALSGYSLGGPVAIRAAARHPDRVTALVLTATFPYRDNRLALALPSWRKLAESGNREVLAEYLMMMALGADALEAMPAEQLQQAIGSLPPTSPTAPPSTPSWPPGRRPRRPAAHQGTHPGHLHRPGLVYLHPPAPPARRRHPRRPARGDPHRPPAHGGTP